MSTARGALALLLAVTMASAALANGPFTFSSTGQMGTTRVNHSATLLSNGKVLAFGGSPGVSADLYDPSTGTWAATASMSTDRAGHTLTLLANGQVLVADGSCDDPTSAELYDPNAGTWFLTAT